MWLHWNAAHNQPPTSDGPAYQERRRCEQAGRVEEEKTVLNIKPINTQLTAFFTSAPILASSAAVNSFSAKAVGHMAPSSRFASSLKPNVAYLDLNFCAL